jgi:general secretion pathway protein M
MSPSFSIWWRSRTPREQRLLLVMFGLLAVVLAWLLVVRPLGDALSAAKERHGAAVVALAEAKARAAAIGEAQGSRPSVLSGPLDALISQSATEAGFPVTRLDREGAGRVTLVVSAARPQALFGWVNEMESARGVIVERLKASANSDQTLSVQVTFRARGGR